MSAKKEKITIRPCREIGEYAACVDLQRQAWGAGRREVYPTRLFVVIERLGGRVLGAFTPGDLMVGFVVSMPAWRGAERYYYSLAMGVAPEFQNRGIAQALKWEQRRHALRAGINRIEWTFDPLRAKNAFLNIQRLGAIARRYEPDFFGAPESNSELRSDRLVCEWWLKSKRVRRAARGLPPTSSPSGAAVALPADLWKLIEHRPRTARAVQLALRRELIGHFRRGYAVTGFSSGTSAAYLLDRLPQNEV